jgi:esterase/lipase superfamily enzyme
MGQLAYLELLLILAVLALNGIALWLWKRWASARELEHRVDLEEILAELQKLQPRKTSAEGQAWTESPSVTGATQAFTKLFPPASQASPDPTGFTEMFQAPAAAAPRSTTPGDFTRMFRAPINGEWAEVNVFYATDRRPTGSVVPAKSFSSERSTTGELSYGSCKVSIPRDHRMGALEAPRLFKLQFAANPAKHVVLLSISPETKAAFFASISGAVESSTHREALVFIHGYNVAFEDAARRTAQIAYDLGFDGVPILYSWPSEALVHSYPVDEANAEWSIPHFKSFLKDVAELCGTKTIHIVAHSMGNRLLISALNQFTLEGFVPPTRFHEVVLAAPDIDADTFRQLAATIRHTALRVTLYASASDKALILSRRFHRYPRAGEYVFPVEGIDIIDASAVDTGLVGHSYYGDNRSVLSDIFWLLRNNESPSKRFGMMSMATKDGTYYAFLP